MGIRFTGPFAPMCEQFVAQKRAFGSDYTQQEKLLHMFDNFSKAYPVDSFVISEASALLVPKTSQRSRFDAIQQNYGDAAICQISDRSGLSVVPHQFLPGEELHPYPIYFHER